MEQIIALDIGETRTGIAKSDSMGIIVKPLKTILTKDLAKELKQIQEEYTVNKIIIGLPKNMDGTEGNQTNKVKQIVDQIKTQLDGIELVYEDERLSSKEAETILKEKGIKISKDNKDLIDMYAAAIILEQYLSRQ